MWGQNDYNALKNREAMAMQLTIRVSDEKMAQIEWVAKQMGLKKTDITRMAINQFLEDYAGDTEKKPYERVKHLLGKAQSGVPDLGKRHRHHGMFAPGCTGNSARRVPFRQSQRTRWRAPWIQ